MQVNGADVRGLRGVRGSMAKHVLGKLVAQLVATINLDNKEIGDKDAAEAVAAMLLWSAPTLTSLSLRYGLGSGQILMVLWGLSGSLFSVSHGSCSLSSGCSLSFLRVTRRRKLLSPPSHTGLLSLLRVTRGLLSLLRVTLRLLSLLRVTRDLLSLLRVTRRLLSLPCLEKVSLS